MGVASLDSLEYIPQSGPQEVLICKDTNNLSKLTYIIMDSILKKDVVIVFSQGPLNFSSLIASLYSYTFKRDVVIGIPKRHFSEFYKKNTRAFFSLLFKRKNYSNTEFFYQHAIWGKGNVDDNGEEMTGLEIEKKPVHGISQFRKIYFHNINSLLRSGAYETTPKIISIPLSRYLPNGIIGDNAIRFESKEYRLSDFNPELFVLESINERPYNFEYIIGLIEKAKELNKHLVLHFSWPYLKGTKNFLDALKEDKDIAIFHLGKRLCIESNPDKPPDFGLELSLEGDLWDATYYPKTTSPLNYEILLPYIPISDTSFDNVKNFEWGFDRCQQSINHYADNGFNIDYFDKNLLKFPPIIDTFVSPNEIKKRGFIDDSIRYLPIKEYFSNKYTNNKALQAFNGLIYQIENSKDLAYQIRGLKTKNGVTKRTLFQAYLLSKIQTLSEKDVKHTEGVIIADLHPHFNLATKSPLFNSVDYLIGSISEVIQNYDFPSVKSSRGETSIEIGKEQFPLIENGVINQEKFARVVNKIKSIFSSDVFRVQAEIDSGLRMKVLLDLGTRVIKFDKTMSNGYPEIFPALELYSLAINKHNYREKLLSDICLNIRDYGNLRSKINLISTIRTANESKQIEKTLEFSYLDISKIVLSSSMKQIKETELLIPGPIPFHTYSEDEIRISQGFDTLLLPFKKVIFFAYPGWNFSRLSRQIGSYKDIFIEGAETAAFDLNFSLKYLDESNRSSLGLKDMGMQEDMDEGLSDDTPIDTILRKQDLKTDHGDGMDPVTLKDIWNKIKISRGKYTGPQKREYGIDEKDIVSFEVEFEGGQKQILTFHARQFIRKKVGSGYSVCQVDEISPGDEIVYLQTEDREGIDNFFLNDFIEEESISLEDILRPFVHMKLFYSGIKELESGSSEEPFKKLKWLSAKEQDLLAKLFNNLLGDANESDISQILSSGIWLSSLNPQDLISLFHGVPRIDYGHLYKMAKLLGPISIKESTFKQYNTMGIGKEKSHYYFLNEEDLLTIGKLLGDFEIIERYRQINQSGKQIASLFQTVGHSVSRVIQGRADPLNMMDAIIKEKIKKCTVVSRTDPK